MSLSPNLHGIGPLIGWGVQNFIIARISKGADAIKTSMSLHSLCFFLTLLLLPIFGIEEFELAYIPALMLSSVLMALGFLSYVKGFGQGSVSIVAPIVSSKGIITAVLSFIFLDEEITPLKIIGIIITFSGVILLSTDFRKLLQDKKVSLLAGAKWACLCALMWGISCFIHAVICQVVDWYTANLGLRFFVFVTFLILSPLLRLNAIKVFTNINKALIIASVFDCIGAITYNIGLAVGDPSVVTILSGASALITITLGIILLKEKINATQIFGILLTIAGVVALSMV